MPTFIETCNCKGTRPSGVTGTEFHSRPNLIGAMLKDRYVPRFLVAPTGFGKSSIVYEYASIMFAFKHVFWIKCDSPCFLRDLDAKTLLLQIKECDDEPKLVICEDVPRLNDDRSVLFNDFMDAVLGIGCEIVVTMVPSSERSMSSQFECIRLSSTDLLLSDDEMTIEEVRGALGKSWRHEITEADRIPSLRWSHDGIGVVLEGFRNEDIPSDMKLVALILLVCRFGQLDILDRFMPHDRAEELLGMLRNDYPLLGIDMQKKTYCTLNTDIPSLSKRFCPHIEHWIGASLYSERDRFCNVMAECLMEADATDRAAVFMDEFATKQSSALWLVKHGWRLMQCGNIMGCLRLYDSCKRGGVSVRDELTLIRAWLLYILGDTSSARRAARKCIKSRSLSAAERLQASILCGMYISPDTDREEVVEKLSEYMSSTVPREAKEVISYTPVDWCFCAQLAQDYMHGNMQRLKEIFNASSVAVLLEDSENEDFRQKGNTLLLVAAYILSDTGDEKTRTHLSSDEDNGEEVHENDSLAYACASFVEKCIELRGRNAKFDLFVYMCASALLCAGEKDRKLKAYTGIRGISERIDTDVAWMSSQSDEFRRYNTKELEDRMEFRRLHPDSFRKEELVTAASMSVGRVIPTLHVSLFGGLQVSISSEPVDSKLLSRKKAKTALALLVANKGREISRDQLADSLWPDAGMDAYTRNFYSIWSALKKALSVGGSCPYLIRSQGGCRIEIKYVTSDIFVFEELCRKLLFGTDETVVWEKLYAQVNEDFADDLLPSEYENREIAALREKYRNNLIDGLVATSIRLNNAGESRGALWFAREAIRRDDKREDSYIALMEAQIASNQRGAALETYFACRRFLNEELGIDPSAKVVQLYRSIIETVADFE